MLCEWITDCGDEPVNRFENFDLYKQIARRMRRTAPLDQLRRPHFSGFEVAHDVEKTYYNLTQYRNYHKAVECALNSDVYNSDNEVYKQHQNDYSSDEDNCEFDLNDLNLDDITETIQTMCHSYGEKN